MSEKSKNKTFEIFRWVSVLPGSILIGFLVLFPLHWALYFTLVKGSIVEMPFENIAPLERFLSPIITSIIFVYAGAKIAPKKQFLVSIILFILSVFFRIGAVFIVATSNLQIDLSPYGLSRLVLSLLASGAGVFLIYRETNKKIINPITTQSSGRS